MNSYDFLFLYQFRNRELENILLLKNELELRGYSVKIEPFWRYSQKTKRVQAKVVVGQADDDWQLRDFSYFAINPNKAISFKWEQIYTNSSGDRTDVITAIRGKAQSAVTLAWGENSFNRYVNVYGVSSEKIKLTGHITLDFLRNEFKSYYKSREDICREFSLDGSKNIYLYISSFSYASIPKEDLKGYRYQNNGTDPYLKINISNESQKETLKWLDSLLKEHPEIEFVYRPHPAETSNKTLLDFANTHKNFHMISDYSVKQWILICDKIYTWYSTSVGEVFAANKSCAIVRPVPIPFDIDVELYKNAKVISDYESFENDFSNTDNSEDSFPIPADDMKKYYYVPQDSYTFELIADVCEDVYKSDEYIIDDFPTVNRNITIPFRIKVLIRRYLGASKFCLWLSNLSMLKGKKFAESVKMNREDHEHVKKNVPSKRELAEMEASIKKMLLNRKPRTDK